jgi:hypothetical protein
MLKPTIYLKRSIGTRQRRIRPSDSPTTDSTTAGRTADCSWSIVGRPRPSSSAAVPGRSRRYISLRDDENVEVAWSTIRGAG